VTAHTAKKENMKKTALIIPIAAIIFPVIVFAQNDWRTYGNDPGHARFSTSKQITPQNVSGLQPAWTFDLKATARTW